MAVQIRADYVFIADDLDQAARVLLKAIPIARDQVSGYHQLYPLIPAARLLTEAGRTQLAARILGAFRRNRANIGADFLYLMLPSVEDRVREDRLAHGVGRRGTERRAGGWRSPRYCSGARPRRTGNQRSLHNRASANEPPMSGCSSPVEVARRVDGATNPNRNVGQSVWSIGRVRYRGPARAGRVRWRVPILLT